jgi:hypothetical protein
VLVDDEAAKSDASENAPAEAPAES